MLPEALIIFTILSRNPTFVSNEFKKLLPHPDGDLHTMINAWHAAAWLQHLTQGLEKETATKIWESIIFLSVSMKCYVNIADLWQKNAPSSSKFQSRCLNQIN